MPISFKYACIIALSLHFTGLYGQFTNIDNLLSVESRINQIQSTSGNPMFCLSSAETDKNHLAACIVNRLSPSYCSDIQSQEIVEVSKNIISTALQKNLPKTIEKDMRILICTVEQGISIEIEGNGCLECLKIILEIIKKITFTEQDIHEAITKRKRELLELSSTLPIYTSFGTSQKLASRVICEQNLTNEGIALISKSLENIDTLGTQQERVQALSSITIKNIQDFLPTNLFEGHIKCALYGNISEEQTDIWEQCCTYFPPTYQTLKQPNKHKQLRVLEVDTTEFYTGIYAAGFVTCLGETSCRSVIAGQILAKAHQSQLSRFSTHYNCADVRVKTAYFESAGKIFLCLIMNSRSMYSYDLAYVLFEYVTQITGNNLLFTHNTYSNFLLSSINNLNIPVLKICDSSEYNKLLALTMFYTDIPMFFSELYQSSLQTDYNSVRLEIKNSIPCKNGILLYTTKL